MMADSALSYPYDLGSYIARGSELVSGKGDADTWFCRGLVWCFGFHHEEAERCFRAGIEADPSSIMNYWGLVYAVSPDYNRDWDSFDEAETDTAFTIVDDALAKAGALLADATPVQHALIDALGALYPADRSSNKAAWVADYATALAAVYAEQGDLLDVACLYAEALMNKTPWSLWNLATGTPADGADTLTAKAVLERALDAPGGRQHPGLLHFHIHLMEMSPTPESALISADSLRGLVPDSGHLQHMPTHIDVLCGHYQNVITWNHHAINADRIALELDGPINMYSLYRCHNLHFKLYGAMFAGNLATARATADEMERQLTPQLIATEHPPMADWLEGFVPMGLHVLIRFGLWDDILNVPFPDDRTLFCTTTAMLHYARTVALTLTDRIPEAQAEASLFESAVKKVPESRYVFNNTCIDILAIAREMMFGELEYGRGHIAAGFGRLRAAVALDDALPYDEPWGWMQPTRHALGALLLEQGEIQAAADVYRADLGFDDTLSRACQHPENVWSLHGYHECLVQLGRNDEARIIRQRLDLALARSDVDITSSCFCRRDDGRSEEVATVTRQDGIPRAFRP